MAASGYPAESFKELADIVHPTIVKAGFEVIIERNGGKPPVAILLACPMRAGNLASLDLERHITTRHQASKIRYAIRIEGREVKNDKSIDVDLGTHACEILTVYLKKFRHAIADVPGTALFPQRSGGACDPGNFLAKSQYGFIARPDFAFTATAARIHGTRALAKTS